MKHLRATAFCLLLSVVSLVSFAPWAQARPQADSVILLIGDGMGPGQIEMTRGALGRPLEMERMDFSGVMATRSLGGKVTDSAAAATAMYTGHKVTNGVMSLSTDGKPLETIAERCLIRHKTVGVITTDALWGATPGALLAHTRSRGERSEIARQMAESRAQVMCGYWTSEFLPKSADGKREDGKDLIAWLRNAGYQVVYTRDQLKEAQKQKLVGLFDDGDQAPTLADIVSAALDRLGTNASGFFVMVEGARVDWAGHDSDPLGVFAETRDFDQAVGEAMRFARKRGRTLVLVTADHETGGLQVEAPARLPVLTRAKGTLSQIASHLNADRTNVQQVMRDYAGIEDLKPKEIAQIKQDKDPAQAIAAVISAHAGVKWTEDGDHTATPVRVFAFGPGAERFTGEMDNTDLPKRIADILGIGPFPTP